MPNNTSTMEEKLREEWSDFIGNQRLSNQKIADWWLSKLSLARQEERDSVRKKLSSAVDEYNDKELRAEKGSAERMSCIGIKSGLRIALILLTSLEGTKSHNHVDTFIHDDCPLCKENLETMRFDASEADLNSDKEK